MKNKESYFDYEIEIDDTIYAYGYIVNLNEKRVNSEWLYKLSENGKDKVVFYRDVVNKNYQYKSLVSDAKHKKKIEGWLDDSIYVENELFISTVIKKQREDISETKIFNDIYKWFSEKLVIMYPDTKMRSFDLIIKNGFNIADMICKLDTGILSISNKFVSKEYLPSHLKDKGSEVVFKDMIKDLNEKDGRKIGLSDGVNLFNVYLNETKDDLVFEKMVFIHDNSEESEMLELHEESDGTRRMIDILMYLINAKIKGQTLIIDEIERSLHPNLVKELVNYYTQNDKNKRTQLIYSTHDENFIDLTSYRKDTIWLVDKDKSGSSKLTSLDEYDIRSDRRKIQNDYLEGRFGGIPELGSLVEVYDEVESNEGEN
jgi:AAA15 family ATPase/GTPase